MSRIELPNQPAYVSYSSFSNWLRCGNAWYLEKVVKVDSIPSWAMLGGSAVHAASEDYDKGLELREFTDYLDEAVESQMERNPSIDPSEYRATGRASKEWPNKRNFDWWLSEGPKMVDGYIKWRELTAWPLWKTPAGEPAVELQLNFQLTDESPVIKGFIDRVFEPTPGELVILDLKTGTMKPDSTMQNGIYASGVEIVFGVRPRWGTWWMPAKGMTHTELHDLNMWTPKVLSQMFNAFVKGVNDEIFIPKLSNMCGSCGVNKYCTAYGGPEPRDQYATLSTGA